MVRRSLLPPNSSFNVVFREHLWPARSKEAHEFAQLPSSHRASFAKLVTDVAGVLALSAANARDKCVAVEAISPAAIVIAVFVSFEQHTDPP